MARARNIKPGFFANENLAECDPLARLLFAGLWCLADRAGRLEDRPKRIRAELLPYDTCDADELLEQLQKHGFITRYEVDGTRFIQVLNFDKHQNPHMKEAKSSIPTPGGFEEKNEQAPANSDGFADEHQTGTVQIPGQHHANPADSGFSDSLIPDSLNKEAKASSSPAALPDCPHNELIDLFAQKLPMLPQPKPELWGGARAKSLKARWVWVLTATNRKGERYATDKRDALDFFSRYFDYVAGSNFLTGRSGQWTGCDLAWLANETNFAKVMQGNYDNKDGS